MVVTTQGLDSISVIIGGSALAVPSHSAIGSGTSVAAIGDTSLEHEWLRNPVTAKNLDTGMFSLLGGLLTGAGDALQMVLLAPVSIGEVVASTLTGAGLDTGDGTSINTVALIIKFLIAGILYAIIIFSIISAFLQGGKL